MEKILFITAFVPNDNAAAEKNTKLMLEELSMYYDIDLVYFKYQTDEEYVIPNNHIKILCSFQNSLRIKIVNTLLFPFVYPLFSVRFSYKTLLWLRKHINKNTYKSIIFDHSQMFLYAKFLNVGVPKIMLSHDVIAQRIGRTSNKLLSWYCQLSEDFCLSTNNSHLFALSEKDCNLIKTLYGKTARKCCLYLDRKVIESSPTNLKNEFVFIGKWSRKDNVDGVIWFFKEIAPLIEETIVVNIVGRDFPTHKIKNINSKIRVNIKGFMDNPYELIANSRAVLSPLFTGAGVKVKVIEALACGTPVIGTDIAFEGINTEFAKFMLKPKTLGDWKSIIENINIPISERLCLKKNFISDYQSETIPLYLKNYLHI